jgi:hypothetical protein
VAAVYLPSFGLDSPLLFQFSPVLVSLLRREVAKVKIHVLPVMLRAGTVQPSPPVELQLDLVELAVMQQKLNNPYSLVGANCSSMYLYNIV